MAAAASPPDSPDEKARYLSLKLQAFDISSLLLESYGLQALFYPELRLLRRIPKMLSLLLRSLHPALFTHMQRYGLSAEMVTIPWFQTCFVYVPNITVGAVNAILDIFIVERSYKILFRVGLAIFKVSEARLLSMDLEGMMEYFSSLPGGSGGWLEPEALLKLALGIKVTRTILLRLEEEVIAAEDGRGAGGDQH